MQKKSIQDTAKNTLLLEANSILELQAFINDQFEEIVTLIHNIKGRLVISGIGKSAIIAQKIVATLNSTGTPSIFMHAADAIHGDLGMIQKDDIILIISKSGESPEIKVLVTLIKNLGNMLIAMAGNTSSVLALEAGALGKKLYLRVSDLSKFNECPSVFESSSLKDVILEITKKRLGLTAVVDDNKNLSGVITDGDLRRMLEKGGDFEKTIAKDIMSTAPKTIDADALAVDALDKMRKNNITQLIVVNDETYAGVIHLHDLIREGLI